MADPARLLDRDTPGYDEDFCRWAEAQASLLRAGRFDALDIENLAEEVEDMAKRDRRAVESNLRIVLIHLLKYRFQPEERSGSWLASIREHRLRIWRDLRDSPSRRRHLAAEFSDCYRDARRLAADETGLAVARFPEEPFLDVRDALDEDYLPDAPPS